MFTTTVLMGIVGLISAINPQQEDMANLRATITSYHQTYLQTLIDGDVEAYANLFTEEGILLFPGEFIQGKTYLKTRQINVMKQVKILDGAIHTLTLEASGNLAYEIGRFQYSLKTLDNGKKVDISGRFLVIWKKMDDGTWKIAVDSGFPDP